MLWAPVPGSQVVEPVLLQLVHSPSVDTVQSIVIVCWFGLCLSAKHIYQKDDSLIIINIDSRTGFENLYDFQQKFCQSVKKWLKWTREKKNVGMLAYKLNSSVIENSYSSRSKIGPDE